MCFLIFVVCVCVCFFTLKTHISNKKSHKYRFTASVHRISRNKGKYQRRPLTQLRSQFCSAKWTRAKNRTQTHTSSVGCALALSQCSSNYWIIAQHCVMLTLTETNYVRCLMHKKGSIEKMRVCTFGVCDELNQNHVIDAVFFFIRLTITSRLTLNEH